MDVSSIVEYIKVSGSLVDLRALTTHKPWLFSLYGTIDNKLSTSRRHIYDAKQVLKEFPYVTKQVISTVEVVMRKIFTTYDLPVRFAKFKTPEGLMQVIKDIPLSEPNQHVQVLYLCTQMILAYAEDHEGTLGEDEGLLVTGILFIVYRGLERMAGFASIECEQTEAKVIFHDHDH